MNPPYLNKNINVGTILNLDNQQFTVIDKGLSDAGSDVYVVRVDDRVEIIPKKLFALAAQQGAVSNKCKSPKYNYRGKLLDPIVSGPIENSFYVGPTGWTFKIIAIGKHRLFLSNKIVNNAIVIKVIHSSNYYEVNKIISIPKSVWYKFFSTTRVYDENHRVH